MTEIVFLTDIHGNTDAALSIFEREEPDMVLIGGDVTDLGQSLDGVIPFLDEIPAPTFVVPGNCDKREILQIFEASAAVSVHKKTFDMGNITIAGLGGSNPSPFGTPFEHQEDEIAEMLSSMLSSMKKNRWNILLTHAPPYGALDEVAPDVHVGCHSAAEVIREFDIICCGHIHEQRAVSELNGRICVNPGPAKEGNYAVIILDEENEPEIILKNIRDEAVQE